MKMKVVVITGVGGFFGSHLCQRLLRDGVKVYGVDVVEKAHQQFDSVNYHPVTVGFEQYSSLHELISELVDVFFHFAWTGGLLQDSFWNYELQLSNAKSACDAYMAAVRMGAKRFINSGTNNQIEIRQFLSSKTTDYSARATTIYASAKMALEMMIKALATKYPAEYVGTMIPMPYGKGNRSMQLFNVVIKKLLEGSSPKLIEGNNLYDMVYVEDIVGAFIAIAERGVSGRSYYIGHRQLKTFRQWIEEIRDIVNPDVELRFGEYKDSLNMDYTMIDLDLLYKDTGYECVSDFSETVKETIKWMKKNI